jgi:hypothetical protein
MPTAKADEWDKKTILTISEPIQVPKQVLEPGTYVFKLMDSQSDRHIVQIFDKDEKHLVTTVLAIPNYRLKPTGKSKFQFWEVPAGQPKALRAWFYPGDNFGQEFAYPKVMSTQIATYSKTTVPTTYSETTEELSTAKVGSIDEGGKANDLDKDSYTRHEDEAKTNPEPAPAPQEVAQAEPPRQAEPETKPSALPQELPHTASNMPLIGLIGLLSLMGFAVTFRLARAR